MHYHLRFHATEPERRLELFHEIAKRAINEAIEHSRELSTELINAQQARRALDYLVGFNLSPLLWKKIRRGLSAGRVQSPALRMIVEREIEIEKFKPREYWTIEAEAEADNQRFRAKLSRLGGEKVAQFTVTDGDTAAEVEQSLRQAAAGKLVVLSVEKKQRRRNPAPPFTTSTLQQEASRKLYFSVSRTMQVAQQLYEQGHITGPFGMAVSLGCQGRGGHAMGAGGRRRPRRGRHLSLARDAVPAAELDRSPPV